jgi:tryptophan 2,3-dioxygenase
MLLADEVLEAPRAQAQGERRSVGQPLRCGVGEQVADAAKYAQRVTRQEQTGLADEFAPILEGPGASDYERYLRTDELLSLQKTPEERAHHDELLFQTTHQSSELWLKLAGEEMEVATEHLGRGEIAPALRLLRRTALCFRIVTQSLDMLELMSPWEYTTDIRPVLGHGSGFDSPGWSRIRHAAPGLGEAFHALRRAEGLSIADVYVQGREREELYQVAEALTELDEWATTWRVRHYMVVERSIGGEVVGTQGTPVELLGKLVDRKLYPELWKVRTELTNLAKEND